MLRVGRERSKQLGYDRKAKISWIEGERKFFTLLFGFFVLFVFVLNFV